MKKQQPLTALSPATRTLLLGLGLLCGGLPTCGRAMVPPTAREEALCGDIGFKPGTETFGECVLELLARRGRGATAAGPGRPSTPMATAPAPAPAPAPPPPVLDSKARAAASKRTDATPRSGRPAAFAPGLFGGAVHG